MPFVRCPLPINALLCITPYHHVPKNSRTKNEPSTHPNPTRELGEQADPIPRCSRPLYAYAQLASPLRYSHGSRLAAQPCDRKHRGLFRRDRAHRIDNDLLARIRAQSSRALSERCDDGELAFNSTAPITGPTALMGYRNDPYSLRFDAIDQ